MSDNSWYERGELPPSGAVCEARFDNDSLPQWYKCDVIYLSFIGAVLRFYDTGQDHIYTFSDGVPRHFKFRPLKSDRDKAVEYAANIVLHGEGIVTETAKLRTITNLGKLYDAGLLRLPD